MEKEFKELITQIKRYNGKEGDGSLLTKAWKFTKLAHTGQKRLTGEPYASHGLQTAKILAGWRLDLTSIVAGFLHDTIEDGGAKQEDIVKKFGEDVALIVDGVTKVSDLKLRGSSERAFVENLRKLILVMAKDLRVVLVKLADRMHNMQTLSVLPLSKQKRISRETLEIYAPLAERLGIGEVKGQLDDLAFPFLYPNEFRKVKKVSKPYYAKVEKCIKKMRRTLLKKLIGEIIKVEIHAREKHLYSLWRKLERKGISWNFEKLHDIVAMRVVVETIPECYMALGIVHGLYKPVPHIGVSDFIAQPKPNGYRSIHTKVFGLEGLVVEIQIRTHNMHKQAEFGVAAHWAYAEAKTKGAKDEVLETEGVKAEESKLVWVKQLVKWQKELVDSEEFLDAVKFDAFAHRNFIFSPKGDVYDLPEGATPVDYAYAVHTDLGNYIKGAKVDGKIVPLNYILQSGSVCEILKTKKSKEPSRGWLDFVVTTVAKHKISKQYTRK